MSSECYNLQAIFPHLSQITKLSLSDCYQQYFFLIIAMLLKSTSFLKTLIIVLIALHFSLFSFVCEVIVTVDSNVLCYDGNAEEMKKDSTLLKVQSDALLQLRELSVPFRDKTIFCDMMKGQPRP